MDLPYGLVEVGRDFELCDLLSPLKDPEALRAAPTTISPGRKDLLLPGICGRYICRSLWASDEDEIEAALEIIGLQGSTD